MMNLHPEEQRRYLQIAKGQDRKPNQDDATRPPHTLSVREQTSGQSPPQEPQEGQGHSTSSVVPRNCTGEAALEKSVKAPDLPTLLGYSWFEDKYGKPTLLFFLCACGYHLGAESYGEIVRMLRDPSSGLLADELAQR